MVLRLNRSCSAVMLSRNACGLDLSKGRENVPITIRGDPNQEEYPAFQYSPGNVQGPGCDIDPNEVTLPGCSCLSASCSDESCSCLKTHGRAYDGSGLLLDRYLVDDAAAAADDTYCAPPVFECNALCACSDACSNRPVERGLCLGLEVFPTGKRGWGVRATEPVHRGAFVCEYAGEVVGPEEARRRQHSQGPRDNNYIIAVREHAGAAGAVTETFVDPAAVGNVGRFLNHSCRPNLAMVPVRVHSAVPRLALFARRHVCAGEELTFDYSGGGGGGGDGGASRGRRASIEASRTDGLQRKACYCGTQDCTGFLPLDTSVLSNT